MWSIGIQTSSENPLEVPDYYLATAKLEMLYLRYNLQCSFEAAVNEIWPFVSFFILYDKNITI